MHTCNEMSSANTALPYINMAWGLLTSVVYRVCDYLQLRCDGIIDGKVQDLVCFLYLFLCFLVFNEIQSGFD